MMNFIEELKKIDLGLDAVNDEMVRQVTRIVKECASNLQEGSHSSWVSDLESKPATRYICIEYERFVKMFA